MQVETSMDPVAPFRWGILGTGGILQRLLRGAGRTQRATRIAAASRDQARTIEAPYRSSALGTAVDR